MEERVSLVCKSIGKTPLEAMREYCAWHGVEEKTSYAGRLDPMAQGVLLVLRGDQCAQQHAFQNHEKTYYWELLLGLQSDSFDLLGMPTNVSIDDAVLPPSQRWDSTRMEEAVQRLFKMLPSWIGERQQPYPPYSSIRVQGHPLFWWAQQGRLAEVVIPSHSVHIRTANVNAVRWISASLLLEQIRNRIALVAGNGFRQPQIVQAWTDLLEPLGDHFKFPIISIHSRVSSGTYIRSLAYEMGQQLSVGGLAWSINRIAIGKDYCVTDAWVNEPMSRLLFERVMKIVAPS